MGDILFLAHRAPFRPDRGDRIRSYHLLRALGRVARVHLAAFDEGDAGAMPAGLAAGRVEIVPRTKSRLRALGEALASGRPVSLTAFDSAAMRAAVTRMLAEEPIDTIVVFSGQMAQYLPADFGGRTVIDFVDVDSAKFDDYARRATPPLRQLYRREAQLLAGFERLAADRADASLFVSEAEAELFRQRSGARGVRALGNGIDLVRFDPAAKLDALPPLPRPLILFTGQMDYPPNVEAACGFARRVLPAIRARHPRAQFAIVGRAPAPAVQALDDLPGVIVTGEVPDTRPWIARADVVVAPLAIARGVQNKLLEAMAMARPAVATPPAFEGIDAVAGRDLIVAGMDAQADAILALIEDPTRAEAIGQAARKRMIERYEWAAQLAALPCLVGRERLADAAE